MRLWGDAARQLYNQLFSRQNIPEFSKLNMPKKTFQWKNIAGELVPIKSVTDRLDARWGDTTRQLYNQLFSKRNIPKFSKRDIPKKAFQWKNIPDDPVSIKSVIDRFDAQSINVLSEAINISLKVGLPSAYVLGFFVTVAYLSNSGAPFPISDFSTTLWLITVAALIAFLAIVVAGMIFYVPFVYFPITSKLLRDTRSTHPVVLTNLHKPLREFAIEWFANNTFPLVVLLIVTLWFFFGALPATLVWSMFFVGAVVSIAVTICLVHRYSFRYKKFLSKPRFYFCAVQVLWRVLRASIIKGFLAWWWVSITSPSG